MARIEIRRMIFPLYTFNMRVTRIARAIAHYHALLAPFLLKARLHFTDCTPLVHCDRPTPAIRLEMMERKFRRMLLFTRGAG